MSYNTSVPFHSKLQAQFQLYVSNTVIFSFGPQRFTWLLLSEQSHTQGWAITIDKTGAVAGLSFQASWGDKD